MKKILDKILNTTLVVLLVANLISYQFVLPMKMAIAEDGGSTEAAVTASDSDSSSSNEASDKDASDKDKDKEAPKKDAAVESEVVQDTNTDKVGGSDGTTIADNKDNDNIRKNDSIDPAPLLPAFSTVPNPTGLSTNNDECSCGIKPENLNNIDPKPDCNNPCPSDCQCCIDYCTKLNPPESKCETCPPADCETSIEASNIAQNSANTSSAVSDTGENAIVATSGSVAEDDNNNANDASDNEETAPAEETASPNASQATIITGDALAQVAAVNTVNTNIYTENGIQVVENITGDYSGDINLLSAFNNMLDSAQNLNSENQDFFEHITITNVNVAKNVENTAVAEADSGENSIENASGSASIVSGDAQASASAVNFINTNITGNNWLMAVINVAGNWTGNLIVPGEGLLELPSANMIFDKIVSIDLAENIRNFLSSDASTGTNSISSTSGSAQIQSGDADSSASGMSLVNTNIVRNNWFFLMINNSGNWLGRVMNWEGGSQNTVYEYNFGSLEGSPAPSKCVSVYNYNSAENVNNTVIASANTGKDSISGAESASILTGNADARASALNFINTNITGNNWMFGVVNNSGNWTGDVIFGYPDLEVSLSSDKSAVQPGDSLDFTVHYKNAGQAKGANASLMLSLPDYLSSLPDYSGFYSKSGNDFYWPLGDLEPGEEGAFTLKTLLASDIPNDVTSLEAAVGAKTDTKEAEFSNNYDGEKINIVFPEANPANSNVTILDGDIISADDSKLKIERSEESRVTIGNVASHYITVKNNGKNILYNFAVKEKIKDPSGTKIAEYIWPIAQLEKGQSAFIEYQLSVDASAKLGTYEHSASAIAYDEAGNEIESEKAESLVEFIAGLLIQPVSANNDEIVPAVQEIDQNPSQIVLGTSTTEKHIPWQWLLALLLLPLAYIFWKKKLYEKHKIAGLIRQTASALFSFLF